MWHLVLSELQGHVTMSKKLKHKKSCLRQCSRNVTNTTARTRMSCCLNVSSDDCEVSVVGRLFHTCAAATGKAQSLRVRRRVIGTSSAVDDPACSLRRESTSATGTRTSLFWILLELRTTVVVVTTGAIRCAKAPNRHQQTNTQ